MLTAAQVAERTGLSRRWIAERASKEGWPTTVERNPRGASRKLFMVESLPEDIRSQVNSIPAPLSQQAVDVIGTGGQEYLRDAWGKANPKQRAKVKTKLEALDLWLHHRALGKSVREASALVEQATGRSHGAVSGDHKRVKDHPREDWPALLLDQYKSVSQPDYIHPEAWERLLSSMLRLSAPDLQFEYDQLAREYLEHPEWGVLPSYRSILRRWKRDVPELTKVLRREGEKAFDRRFARPRIDKSNLIPMGVLNGDGREHDVFVKWPASADGICRVSRPTSLVWQDTATGKIVGWLIAQTENWSGTLIALSRAISEYGVPDTVFVDNGHAYASKILTANAGGKRYRYKDRPGDPDGILKGLGIGVEYAPPGSPQLKSVERAHGGLARRVDKHRRCQGAYCGKDTTAKPDDYRTHAVPLDEFREIFAAAVEWWNNKRGRTQVCAGRTRNEAFAELMAARVLPPRTLTEKQLYMLTLPLQRKKIAPDGTVTLNGTKFGAEEMHAHAGKFVDLRYDEGNFRKGLSVSLAGIIEPLCHALPIGDVLYENDHQRLVAHQVRRIRKKAARDEANAIGRLSPRELDNGVRAKRKHSSNVIAARFDVKPELVEPRQRYTKEQQAIADRFAREERERFEAELAKSYTRARQA